MEHLLPKNSPRVLLFDIETRYIIFRGWRTGKQYVDQSQIVLGEDSDIICIAYKWLGEPKVHSLTWDSKTQSSSQMIEAFSKIVESADLCVGHNSDSFDMRHINTQRMLHDQDPIAWPTSEDTLKGLRKHFNLPSYRLDYISKLLTGSGKKKMNFDDWIEVVERKSKKALVKMVRYCERDVVKLEQIYKRLSRYMKPKVHAGIAKYNDRDTCPRCSCPEFRKNGTVLRITGRVQRYQCLECATVFMGKRLP